MEFNTNTPIYIQIMDEVKRLIVIGQYHCNDKIPPVRELAMQLGVNPNTVQRALSELEREGLLISERTNGRFVTGDASYIKNLKEAILNEKIDQFIFEVEEFQFDTDELLNRLKEKLQHE